MFANFKDLVSLKRLGRVSVHPKGLGAAFTYTSYDIITNIDTSHLAWVSFNDGKIKLLSTNVHGQFWFSNDIIGYLRNVNGTDQIFYSFFNPMTSKALNEIQLTFFPSSVGNVKFHLTTNLLTFVASVFSDGNIENSGDKVVFTSGVVYGILASFLTTDTLFVRHWDKYVDPERFSQLFTLPLAIIGKKIKKYGEPLNLLMGTKLETPVPPDGGDEDYEVSPDGKYVAFVSRVPNSNMAWNTNTDIYLVPTDGSRPPSSISAYNKGYDKHPKFSLDGSWLAWLQMPTPGYEADMNRIALHSMDNSLDSFELKDWDRSPESITWTENGLVISAQEMGRLKLFKVTFDGMVEPWISEGSSHQLSYIPNYGFVFVKNSLTDTSDIFTSVKNVIRRVTNLNQDYMKNIQLTAPEVNLDYLNIRKYGLKVQKTEWCMDGFLSLTILMRKKRIL
jgi:hypothetical protein